MEWELTRGECQLQLKFKMEGGSLGRIPTPCQQPAVVLHFQKAIELSDNGNTNDLNLVRCLKVPGQVTDMFYGKVGAPGDPGGGGQLQQELSGAWLTIAWRG